MEKQRVRKEKEQPAEDDGILEEKELQNDDWILEGEPTFQTVISYQRELENFKQSLLEIQKLIEIPDHIKTTPADESIVCPKQEFVKSSEKSPIFNSSSMCPFML